MKAQIDAVGEINRAPRATLHGRQSAVLVRAKRPVEHIVARELAAHREGDRDGGQSEREDGEGSLDQ